jgi:hypothetical protein
MRAFVGIIIGALLVVCACGHAEDDAGSSPDANDEEVGDDGAGEEMPAEETPADWRRVEAHCGYSFLAPQGVSVLRAEGPAVSASKYGIGAARRGIQSARWPIWGGCSSGGVPLLDESQEPSVESLLQMIRGTKPMTLISASGVSAPVDLRVTALPQTACFAPEGISSTLDIDEVNVDAELTLSSAALPGPVHLPVQLLGELVPGARAFRMAGVGMGLLPCGDVGYHSPQDFVTHCGDWGVDLRGYDAASLEVESHFDANEGYAVFRVRGSTFPGCSPSPEGITCPDSVPVVDLDIVTLGEVKMGFQ